MKKQILGLAALFFTLPLWAQIQFGSLDDVLAYADKNSLTAKAAELTEQAAAKNEQLYRSTLLPRLDLATAADYNIIIPSMVVPDKLMGGTDGKYSTIRFGLPFVFTPALEFSLPLINPEKWEELKKYVLEKEKAHYHSAVQLEYLHIQLAQAYFNALAAKELLALAAESKKTVAQLLTVLELRKKEGVLQPVAYNRAKLLQADIDNNAIQWRLLLAKSMNELQQLLHIPETDSLLLAERFTINWQLTELAEASQRPRFLLAKTASKIAEQSILQSKKATLPKLSLQARYAYQWQVQKGQTVQFDMSTVGLRLSVPLFAGGFYKTAQKRAALLTEAAKADEQQSLAQVKKEQANWMIHFTAAADKQKSLQQKIRATSDNLRIAQLSLEEGVMEFDEFHTIFQEWLSARMEHLQVINEGLFYQFLLTQKR
ncbi:MAG TPA: TolC family protein [Flavisolibacter sp.]|jgi:outer membrane protein TolC|nr:TolC family protein [Flavisolibacter sp.]